MATYTWARTRNQIIEMVLRKLGVLGIGAVVQAEDSEVVTEAIDARLKELHTLGVLWFNVSGAQTSVTVTAGQVTATISATDYLFPVSMMLTSADEQVPLEIIGHRQYQAIGDKAQSGTPERVFIDGATCRFWPVPNLTTTAKLTYQAIAADSENDAAIDLPVAMTRAFVSLVAGDLVDDFAVSDQKAARLIAQQPQALRTIRTLMQERVDTQTVTPEWY